MLILIIYHFKSLLMPKTKRLLIIPLLFLGTLLVAQKRTITGKVISSNANTPVPGATISVKGTTQGVSTSTDGSFSISVPAGRVTLHVSSVGFENKEVIVDPGLDIVTINLAEDTRQLHIAPTSDRSSRPGEIRHVKLGLNTL